MKRFLLLTFVVLVTARGFVRAGEAPSIAPSSAEPGFTQGTHEFEAFGSYLKSLSDTHLAQRPFFDTALVAVRYGWMLDNRRPGMFFGNEEFLLEGFVGPVLQGPGSVLGGGALQLRHNFAWGRHPFFVPYFQIGAGLVASDASSDKSQFAIGLPVEFNLQTGLGARWRMNASWSINTEFDYRHISNAGLSSRNGGYDLIGGFIGLGRMF